MAGNMLVNPDSDTNDPHSFLKPRPNLKSKHTLIISLFVSCCCYLTAGLGILGFLEISFGNPGYLGT